MNKTTRALQFLRGRQRTGLLPFHLLSRFRIHYQFIYAVSCLLHPIRHLIMEMLKFTNKHHPEAQMTTSKENKKE